MAYDDLRRMAELHEDAFEKHSKLSMAHWIIGDVKESKRQFSMAMEAAVEALSWRHRLSKLEKLNDY